MAHTAYTCFVTEQECSKVIAVALKYCRCCFPCGVGRNSRGSTDYSCCRVPKSRIRTMRGPHSVFVAQIRCTCCDPTPPSQNSETSHVAGEAFFSFGTFFFESWAAHAYFCHLWFVFLKKKKVGPCTQLCRWIPLPHNYGFCQNPVGLSGPVGCASMVRRTSASTPPPSRHFLSQ